MEEDDISDDAISFSSAESDESMSSSDEMESSDESSGSDGSSDEGDLDQSLEYPEGRGTGCEEDDLEAFLMRFEDRDENSDRDASSFPKRPDYHWKESCDDGELADAKVIKAQKRASTHRTVPSLPDDDDHGPSKKRKHLGSRKKGKVFPPDTERTPRKLKEKKDLTASSTRTWIKEAPSQEIFEFRGKREVRSLSLRWDPTPLQCFKQFFSRRVLSLILEKSNEHARRSIKGGNEGRLISERELLAFFGLRIMMGIVRMPTLGSYWQKKEWLLDYAAPNEVFTRERYFFIQRYLQFYDGNNSSAHLTRDRLYPIRPLLDLLLPRFESAYFLGPNLSIDETLIPFKGRLRFRQFIPTKRARYGIKVWVLAESETGYVSRIQIYTGRISGARPELGLAKKVVKDLISPFAGKWHRLYVDNFYTSPELFEYLLGMGIYACGTVRHNRKGFPQVLVIDKANKKPRGFSDWRTSGPLLAQSWIDNRPVYFMSTFHPPEYDSTHDGKKTVRRRGTRITHKASEIYCPPLLHDYNAKMGGVDLGDQMRKYYNLTRRSHFWYQRVFCYLLEVAILNAKVLYEQATNTKISGLDFRVQLSNMLIGDVRSPRVHKSKETPVAKPTEPRMNDNQRHYPRDIQIQRDCVVCKKRLKKNRIVASLGDPAKSRPPRSNIICIECNVPLCVREKPCWIDWHTKKEFWK